MTWLLLTLFIMDCHYQNLYIHCDTYADVLICYASVNLIAKNPYKIALFKENLLYLKSFCWIRIHNSSVKITYLLVNYNKIDRVWILWIYLLQSKNKDPTSMCVSRTVLDNFISGPSVGHRYLEDLVLTWVSQYLQHISFPYDYNFHMVFNSIIL